MNERRTEPSQARLDDVLLEFRIEAGGPNPAVLEAYCRRYPQFARELTDYAVEWLIDDAMDASDEEVLYAATAEGVDVEAEAERVRSLLLEAFQRTKKAGA